MNKRKIIAVLGIISILIGFFLAAYYNLILINHEGPMDLWAILLLCIPVGVLILFIILELLFPTDSFIRDNKRIDVISFVFIILFFPIILVLTLFSAQRYNVKKRLKFLKQYGFKVEVNKNLYTYKLDNIYIFINQDDNYKISNDNGKTYINIHECNIGEEFDKYRIKDALIRYQCAHFVDKQRGDAPDTLEFVIIFLKKNIDEIIKYKNK